MDQDQDYYTILCVSRQATSDDIRNAYLTISREFHPDKQPTQTNNANKMYPLIDHAYKILSDTTLRRIYDAYGEEGLEAVEQNQELATAIQVQTKTSEEMAWLIENIIRERNLERLCQGVPASSTLSIKLDVQDFIEHPKQGLYDLLDPQQRYVSVDRMVIKQNATIPLTSDERTNLSLGGYVFSVRGLSHGECTAVLHHTFQDNSVVNVSVSGGWVPKGGVRYMQILSHHSSAWISTGYDLNSGLDMSIGLSTAISKLSNGSVSFGPRQGIQTSIVRRNQGAETQGSISVVPHETDIAASYQFSVSKKSFAKISGRLSTSAANTGIRITGSKKFSARSLMDVSFFFNLQHTLVKFKVLRGSARFVVPIVLCPSSRKNIWSILGTMLVPVFVSAVMNQFIAPRRQDEEKASIQKATEERLAYIVEARVSASMQQQLMERLATKQHTLGTSTNGLVILVARYGQNPSKCARRHAEQREIEGETSYEINTDVTIPLRFFIKNDQLLLHGGSKASLLGFYNPCYGQSIVPELYIRYAFQNAVYEKTFLDTQEIVLPNRGAKTMGSLNIIQ